MLRYGTCIGPQSTRCTHWNILLMVIFKVNYNVLILSILLCLGRRGDLIIFDNLSDNARWVVGPEWHFMEPFVFHRMWTCLRIPALQHSVALCSMLRLEPRPKPAHCEGLKRQYKPSLCEPSPLPSPIHHSTSNSSACLCLLPLTCQNPSVRQRSDDVCRRPSRG